MRQKLEMKDLIHVGIFTALYFVIMFACAMLGYFPLLFILLPVYMPIVTSVPFMLYVMKIEKFGMISLMGILIGLLMFIMGHTWLPLLTGSVFGILADFIMSSGYFKKQSHIVVGYGVFSLWIMGPMMPLWVMRESYLDYIEGNMGTAYAQAVMGLTPSWVLYVVIAATFISGIIGAFFGKSVLRKHFVRAGIV